MRRVRTWAANGLLVIVATAFTLGLAEVAVRLLAPRATSIASQDRYGLALHYPGITRYLPNHDQTVTINDDGMRDREHSLEKPDGTFRVLLLGDSFMEALQVAFEASMPSLLESGLTRQAGRPVEVINGGVSGWGTDDELRYLTEYGLAYAPDLVVVAMTLHNDVSDNLREYWHTTVDGTLFDRQREPIPWLTYRTLRLKAFLAVRLQLAQLWRQVRHGREMRFTGLNLRSHVVQLFEEPVPEEIERGWTLTALLLEQMQTEAARGGAGLAIVLLPVEYQLSEEMFADFVLGAGTALEEMDGDRPQRVMTDIAARLGIPVIDLLPGFRRRTAEDESPLYVSGDGHWNEAGHRLATGVVVRELIASEEIRLNESAR
jgi:GDSL-like lipase/acylhydrolase family protein